MYNWNFTNDSKPSKQLRLVAKRANISAKINIKQTAVGLEIHLQSEKNDQPLRVIEFGNIPHPFTDFTGRKQKLEEIKSRFIRHQADVGVARLSYGPNPYRKMIQDFKTDAQHAFHHS